MKWHCLIVIFGLISCADSSLSKKEEVASSSTSFVTNDTISATRTVVAKKPVASYLVPVNDPRLGRTFGVDIYETPNTFEYLLRMHYEALVVTDTLKIPNFGISPVIKINKGKDKLSCIIGFLDTRKEFREYKMVVVKGDQMRLVVLKKYSTGRYRNVY